QWGGPTAPPTGCLPAPAARIRSGGYSLSQGAKRARPAPPTPPPGSTPASSATSEFAWSTRRARREISTQGGVNTRLTQATHVTRRVALPPDVNHLALAGRHDEHLRVLESNYDVRITARGHDVTLRRDEQQVEETGSFIRDLVKSLRDKRSPAASEIRSALRTVGHGAGADVKSLLSDGVTVPSRRKLITPKTLNQKRYLEAIRTHDLVLAIGPAGTGKSYLAVAMAVSALMKREVARIILTRPAVEAGERLGFLPGDLIEKVHPYLRPLYDALYDMLEPDKV